MLFWRATVVLCGFGAGGYSIRMDNRPSFGDSAPVIDARSAIMACFLHGVMPE